MRFPISPRSRRVRLVAAAAAASLAIVTGGSLAFAVFSNTKSVGSNTFTTSTMAAPTGLAAAGGATKIVLTWTATTTSYATGYNVLRGTASGGPYTQIAQVTPRTATTYTDSPAAGTYYYVLQAYFQNWTSANSSQASARVGPIAFRAAASAAAPSGTLSLSVNVPTGTTASDVMVASIAVRPNTAAITAPAGWTLVRRVDNASATASSLAVYYRVAGASEPANYTWTFSTSTGSAGGIQTFSNVDTAAPINVDAGQNTANGLTHTTPSVTTTVANAMLVTSHDFSSSATWTPPAGMNEAFDTASVTVPNTAGISIEGNYVLQPAAGATGTKGATASNDADVGNAHILALKPAP